MQYRLKLREFKSGNKFFIIEARFKYLFIFWSKWSQNNAGIEAEMSFDNFDEANETLNMLRNPSDRFKDKVLEL